VAYCDRVRALELGDGYSALFLDTYYGEDSSGSQPAPRAQAFELPGDKVHYAPHWRWQEYLRSPDPLEGIETTTNAPPPRSRHSGAMYPAPAAVGRQP
jgi:hypothetical protein